MAAERVDCSNEVVANLANGGIFLFRGIQVPEKQPNVRKYFSMLEDTLDMQAASIQFPKLRLTVDQPVTGDGSNP